VLKKRRRSDGPGAGDRKANLLREVRYSEVSRFLVVKRNYSQISSFCQIVVRTGLFLAGPKSAHGRDFPEYII
jgi:hypothetical protein